MIAARFKLWSTKHRPQLRLAARITLAALLTFVVGHGLGLVQSYWAVLTAVIVSQASVGGSLKAGRERFVGSVGGAVWGVAVTLTLPHADIWGLLLTLTVTLAPLAVATALNPSFRLAPVTAVLLLLTPTTQVAGPVTTAVHRVLEIGLGSLIALAVAVLVLPERAHGVVARATSAALEAMAELVVVLARGVTQARDDAVVDRLQGRIRKAVGAAETAADEAFRERRINLTAADDPAPLCRTLRRLQHDLAMVSRAGQTPLAEPGRSRLGPPTAEAAEAVAEYMRSAGRSLVERKPAPSFEAVEGALDACSAAIADLRREGALREMPDDAVGRIFGLSFALEQLRLNLRDLGERAGESSGKV
jgi:uncharacterized membrane protein YccC